MCTVTETPIGMFYICETSGCITHIFFEKPPVYEPFGETPLLTMAKKQLSEYFAGERRSFDLPITLVGTPFQLAVWNETKTIPYGKTAAYGEVGRRIGKISAGHAVGSAIRQNPISIIIPCHRVIGADGSLVGYGGRLDIKQFLLELERSGK